MSYARRPYPPRLHRTSSPSRPRVRADGTSWSRPSSQAGRPPVPADREAAARPGGPRRRAVIGALGAAGLGVAGVTGVAALLSFPGRASAGGHVPSPAAAEGLGSPLAAEAVPVDDLASRVGTEQSYPVLPPQVLRYGTEHERQFGELSLPDLSGAAGPIAPLPVAIVIHGGAWGTWLGLEAMRPMAQRLASRGLAVWNIEYRGDEGGGAWPALFEDVAAAGDYVARLGEHTDLALDPDRVVAIGHSAGGQLAVWLAGRRAIAPGMPGADPAVVVRGAVGLAGVYDFVAAAEQDNLQIERLFGGTREEMPEAYRDASPSRLLPTGARLAVLHGTGDAVVPHQQSIAFAERARAAGDEVELVLGEGLDHDAWTDLDSAGFAQAEARLIALAVS